MLVFNRTLPKKIEESLIFSLIKAFKRGIMFFNTVWKREMHTAKEAAIAAGEALRRMLGKVKHVTKKGEIDLVTEADLEAEKIILKVIGQNFPHDAIMSEEAGIIQKDSERIWIVDPLDGTTNFAHGFPFFAVSIALQIADKIKLGIVYNPYMDEYFEAVEGMGAYLNKRELHVSNTSPLKESLLGTGFPYDIRKKHKRVLDIFGKMASSAQGIRRAGSAAIDLCYVAAGRLDGFWEQDLKPWDTSAGTIIVTEAGGIITTFDGEKYSPYLKSIVASNPLIHHEMLRLLNL